MPDAAGRIPPVALSVPADKWARIFGPKEEDTPEVARPGWLEQLLEEEYEILKRLRLA